MILDVLGHGLGSRGDLPIPLWQFTWAATAALVISFVSLGASWRQPKLTFHETGRTLPNLSRIAKTSEPLIRILSMGLFFLVLVTGLFGTNNSDQNLNPVTLYVIFWVILQILTCFLGDIWKVLSPFDTIAQFLERRNLTNSYAIPTWSHWFAPIGAFSFLFFELIHPSGDSPFFLALGMLVYSTCLITGSILWGRDWLQVGDTFAVHFRLLAQMAPLHISHKSIRFRIPLSGLSSSRFSSPEVATLLVVLGGVTFDGFGESEMWRDLVGRKTGWANAAIRLFGLIDSIAVIALLFLISVKFMANLTDQKPRLLAKIFAPSLVPIVFGYTLAHYLQLAIDESQTFFFQLSDPFGKGWDLFGASGSRINFNLANATVIAWVQAIGVVSGHIAGVIVAHDRAVSSFSEKDAVRSQYVMFLVMVVYSVLGLWLLLNA
ncbi:MAG: hypothetical protein QF596_04740 [Acidimicrobiales bacterium]|nr:hypothetical protein [Acidimicrobiales bacterium]HJM29260.1 hypothetical protein [Acidimicrobiales bacterium]HJM96556.1 hypothetical protein [Acidimicrobiales bacterium]